MAAAPLILSGVGMGVQFFSQWRAGKAAKKQGEAEKRAAESQAELLDYNASVADTQAQDAIERGADEESRFRSGVRQLIGEQRANIAASGVDVGYGSAVDTQADTEFLGELDALQLRSNAQREAWGFKTQAYDLRKRAKITREEGGMAAEAGKQRQKGHRIAAIGNLATDSASLLAQRYGMEKT